MRESFTTRRGPYNSSASAALRRAFTLLELVVVVVMIAILATVFLPRLTGQSQRQAEGEAIRVQQLVTAAAERSSLAGGQVAIRYTTSDEGPTLAVVSREPAPLENARARTTPSWKPELLIDPLRLEHLELKHATSDGRRLDPRQWVVPLNGAMTRPALSLVLGQKDTPAGAAYRIDLAQDAIEARRTGLAPDQIGVAGSRALQAGPPERAVDLDATGRGDSPW